MRYGQNGRKEGTRGQGGGEERGMEENRTVEHGCEKELLASLRNVSKIFKSDLAGLFETVSDPYIENRL